ncbi:ATP-binding protein [Dyadobacter sp. CY323]|uniref:ATP-binding protein n=1 Tax=Dyadobacter sp. CY323 TaxID=2907302 RepID=UPI001F37DE97|nr:ATP-binding protein [Dyadobacter sp. CY323]MCE6991103.1 ATP-binding protein [Dyadobacter sp. CY323]
MKNSSPIASRRTFVWTALLIVLLVSFTFLTLLNKSKSDAIKNNIQALQIENNSYHKLDTCIAILYAAENNSRLFVVTLDSAYLRLYQSQLGAVNTTLNKFEIEKNGRASLLSNLIASKQQKNEELVRLRMMVDSLVSFSFQTAEAKPATPRKATRKVKVISESSKKDTLAVFAGKQKRKLVKRIIDAIRDKDTLEKAVLSASSSSVHSSDSAFVPVPLAMPTNHSVFESARRDLSATEQELLAINSRIFSNLQHALIQLKKNEESQAQALRTALLTTTSSKFEEISLLIWGSVLLVALLAAMIIWNLVKLYKKDVTIIRHARMTAITTKRKGDMMAHMTHEIRTPLNSIIGFSQLMDSSELDEDLRANVNAIKSASKILLTLVNEILDFSKLETGKIKLHNKPFNITALIDDAVSMLSILADEKKITLSYHVESDPEKWPSGDELRIKQVLINLLTNAIKFTPIGGTVLVTAQFKTTGHQKGLLEIKVKDTGVGIESKYLNSIFEDYVQVESDDNRTVQVGTGLGLAICKRIVDLYKGRIKVESVLGKGSEFTITLPMTIITNSPGQSADNALDAAPTPDTTAAPPTIPEPILNGRKVLVVDDTKINLLLISKILDKLGATYDLTNDGQKAIDLYNENSYDLVITDIHMPVMDGVELTKRIRTHAEPKKARVPIIGFTGSVEEERVTYYKQVGIDEIIPKPVELHYFSTVLKRLSFD